MGSTVGEPPDNDPGRRRVWRGRGRRSRLWTAAWAVGGLGIAALLSLRWVDSTTPGALLVLQSGQPAYLALTAIAAVLAVARRRLRWLVPAIVVALVVGAQLVARHESAREVPARPVGELTVLSANTYFGQADAASIARTVAEHDVDVLVLLEASPALVSRLDAAGLASTHTYRTAVPAVDEADGSMILCSLRCDPVPGTQPPDDGSGSLLVFQQPAVTVHAAGGDVVVRAAHPFPPIDPGRTAWREGLRGLDRWQQGRPEARLVLAGDFNASAAHPAFRHLLGSLEDSAESTGHVVTRTWPRGRRVPPPFVALDHVLTRGLAVRAHDTVRVPGSDHDAVLVQLVW